MGIKAVHTEFIWLSLITEQNLIILDTWSDFSGDAYCRKEVLGMCDVSVQMCLVKQWLVGGGVIISRKHCYQELLIQSKQNERNDSFLPYSGWAYN